MDFFLSGEIDTAAYDAWRAVARPFEKRVKAAVAQRDYGPAIRKFALVPILLRPEFRIDRPERRLWKRREAIADYRTWIDFDEFMAADGHGRERLLVDNLIAAIRDVGRKARRGLNNEQLVRDIWAGLVNESQIRPLE